MCLGLQHLQKPLRHMRMCILNVGNRSHQGKMGQGGGQSSDCGIVSPEIREGGDNPWESVCRCGPEAAKNPLLLPASVPTAAFIRISK